MCATHFFLKTTLGCTPQFYNPQLPISQPATQFHNPQPAKFTKCNFITPQIHNPQPAKFTTPQPATLNQFWWQGICEHASSVCHADKRTHKGMLLGPITALLSRSCSSMHNAAEAALLGVDVHELLSVKWPMRDCPHKGCMLIIDCNVHHCMQDMFQEAQVIWRHLKIVKRVGFKEFSWLLLVSAPPPPPREPT